MNHNNLETLKHSDINILKFSSHNEIFFVFCFWATNEKELAGIFEVVLLFADGNPVTGTGYAPDIQNNIAPMQNGSSNMNGSDKSSDSSTAGSTKGQASRTRVPPGGYSSGLW